MHRHIRKKKGSENFVASFAAKKSSGDPVQDQVVKKVNTPHTTNLEVLDLYA